jgi:hypothetical protein
MGIGASVFLLAVGAILTFALSDQQVGVLDLNAVGWILMAAGVVGLVLTTMIWGRRRSTVVTERPATTAVTEDPVAYRRVEPATRYRRVEERDAPLPPEAP